jgi:hypothetical protein
MALQACGISCAKVKFSGHFCNVGIAQEVA